MDNMKLPLVSTLALGVSATSRLPYTYSTHSDNLVSLHRRTALGDFDELNSLFDDAAIRFPDEFQVNERVGVAILNMTITNLVCFQISVGDVTVSHTQPSDQAIVVDVRVTDLDLTCQMDYVYKYGLLQGDGSLLLETDNNSAFSKLDFQSSTFSTLPPSDTYVEQCAADVEISRMDFEGDFVSSILEVFQRLVRGVVERAIGDVACQELSSIGTTLVTSIVNLANTKLEPYLVPVQDDMYNDPLGAEEQSLNQGPTDVSILPFLDSENPVSKLFVQALSALDLFLGAPMQDDNIEGNDLVINTMIRDRFLDSSRAMTVNASQLPLDSPVFLSVHDRLFETTMTLHQIHLYGLDSLEVFEPFQIIGNRTLQNEMTWSELRVVLDVSVNIKPSSLDDAILQDPTSTGISENITMEVGIENVTAVASLLMLVDQDKLGSIQLGSLLQIEDFLPCLLSVLQKTEVVGLMVYPDQVMEPKLSGFISPGLDRILSDSASAAFAMYTGAIRTALPNIFQTTVRNFVNTNMVQPFLSDATNSFCQPATSSDGLIDFEKFFVDGQYGDVPPMLKEFLDTKLLTANDAGSLKINDALIVPFTKRQTGQAGHLEMQGDLVTLYSEAVPTFGLDAVQLKGFNLHFDQLDSLVEPAHLLDPSSAQVLSNALHVKNESTATLRMGIQGLLEIQGDPVLATYNDITMSISLGGSQIVADILAKMNANSFLQFPIRDITSLQCWLATLLTPTTATATNGRGLALESFLLDIPALDLQMECRNCTSDGLMNVLPKFLYALKASNVTTVFENRLVQVSTDILRSDYMQSYIDKLLVEGSLRCPHSPTFQGLDAESDHQQVALVLSYDSLESIVFAATILMHLSTVVLAESHREYEISNPLSAQLSLQTNQESQLVNFSILDEELQNLTGSGIDRIRDYLNTPVAGDGDLQVNVMLRSSILNEDGALDIEFNDLSLGESESEISLKRVRILGLDSIKKLNVLEVLGPQTIQNSFEFKSLALEVVISIVGNDATSVKSNEEITFSLELGRVDVSAAFFLALDLEQLGKIPLSSVMNMKHLIPCILSAAQDAKITKLQVSAASLNDLKVVGFRDNQLNAAASTSSDIMRETFGALIVSSMPGIFGTTVRTLINNWMSYMIEDSSGVACPSVLFEMNQVTRFVDFRDLLLPAAAARQLGGSGASPYGDLFGTVVGFLKKSVFKTNNVTGLSALNDVLVGPLTNTASNTTGSLIFPGDILNSETKMKVGGLDALVEFKASDARIDNLDTLGPPLDLLEVLEMPYVLNNSATVGVDDRPLHVAIRLLVALSGNDIINVRNELDIAFDFSQLSIMATSMMMIAESRFYKFPLRDVFDLNCWLATIPAPELDAQGTRIEKSDFTASIEEIAAAVSKLNINISCVQCSSPQMTEFAQLISSADTEADVTSAMNDFLNYVGDLAGGEFLQVQIDRMLNDASRKCRHSTMYDANYTSPVYEPFEAPESDFDISYLIMLAGLAIGFLLVIALVLVGIRFVVRRRHKKWLGNLPPYKIRTLARNQNRERKRESEMNAASTSLFKSPEIPQWIRWSIPIVILLNVALFLSGHFSLGATVNVEAEIAGETFKVEQLLEFSIAKSTVDIWNAGGHELAIMILIFSGIWPYTKLFMSLGLWFMPPSRVSVSRRGSILSWLDWLAKWSMVDVFVLVISIVAFRVSIASPDKSFLPEGFYSVEMMVVPLWGLYANMLAQLVSQVSSHFIIYYHRRVAQAASRTMDITNQGVPASMNYHDDSKSVCQVVVDRPVDGTNENRDSLISKPLRLHQFSRPHRGETEKLVVRRGVHGALCIGALCSSILIVVGCSIPSFSLDYLGIVGVAVDFGNDFEKVDVKHSVFSVIQLLMDEARLLGSGGNSLGLFTLSVIFLMTVLVVPIIQGIALIRQWFVPATRQRLARLAIIAEILQDWQYIEVYLVAVFVSSWQLGPVSQYMINAYCENLTETFAKAVHYGVLSKDDAQCFSVQLSIESGFFVLLGGAVILAVVATFVTKACVQYFRDVDTAEKEKACSTSMSDSGFTNTDSDDCDSVPIDAGFSARIDPVPVLFTDSFRWLLHACSSSAPHDLFCPSSEHWDLPEARAVAYDDDMTASIAQGRFLPDEHEMHKKAKHSYLPESKGSSSTYPSPAAAPPRRQLAFDDEISTMQGSIMESVSSQSLESEEWRSSISRNSKKANLKDDLTYATPPGAASRMRSQPTPTPPALSTPTITNGNMSTTISNGNTPSLALSISRSATPSQSRASVTSRHIASNPSARNSIASSSQSRPPTNMPFFRQAKSRTLGNSPSSSSSLSAALSNASSKQMPKEPRFQDELTHEEKHTVDELLLLSEDEQLEPGMETQSEYMEETVDGDDEFEEYTVKTMSEILEDYDVYEDYSDFDDDQSRQQVV